MGHGICVCLFTWLSEPIVRRVEMLMGNYFAHRLTVPLFLQPCVSVCVRLHSVF